jgi:hypothetical protein
MPEKETRLNVVNVWCPRCGSVRATPCMPVCDKWACTCCGSLWEIRCVNDPAGEPSQGKEDTTQNAFGKEVSHGVHPADVQRGV